MSAIADHEIIDADGLDAVVEGKREEWADVLYSADGGFDLPTSYPIDYAIAIHVYTLEDPKVSTTLRRI